MENSGRRANNASIRVAAALEIIICHVGDWAVALDRPRDSVGLNRFVNTILSVSNVGVVLL
jgi:hypothetical protein